MKKYVKPELYYENLQLSQHVIAGCTMQENFTADAHCSVDGQVKLGDLMVDLAPGMFGVSDNCTAPLEGYCYWNGAASESISLFLHNSL